jgi:CBS domain-containing protein
MRCSEIMTSQLECAGPDETVGSIARRMRNRNVGIIPVCDERHRVLGTITDRDLVLRVLAADTIDASTTARSVMSTNVITCRPEDDLQTAEQLMSSFKISRVLCTEIDGRLRGVISLSDLADLDDVHAAHVLRAVSHRELAFTL